MSVEEERVYSSSSAAAAGGGGDKLHLPGHDESCNICYELLYEPVKTKCGHSSCEECLVSWATTALVVTTPEIHHVPSEIPSKVVILNNIPFSCPVCRTQTTAEADHERRKQLKVAYPELYEKRAVDMYDHLRGRGGSGGGDDDGGGGSGEKWQDMVVLMGNTHRRTPPSISPHSGMTRTHHWKFFVVFSQPEIVESVDLILHETWKSRRFVTLRRAPFAYESLGWGTFQLAVYITLKPEWEWLEDAAMDSGGGGGKQRKDRLYVPWKLTFIGAGGQIVRMQRFRKIETEEDIVVDMHHLFLQE